jgi:hypothetical protein
MKVAVSAGLLAKRYVQVDPGHGARWFLANFEWKRCNDPGFSSFSR